MTARSKVVEIRDRGTFIPALATRIDPDNERERTLFARAGFGLEPATQREYVMLTMLTSARSQHDPFAWGDRTMTSAHRFIAECWDTLTSGAVVDVEHLLGETAQPKEPQA